MAVVSRNVFAVSLLAGLCPWGTSAQKGQKMEAPKWLSDEGKDLFNDLQGSDKPYGEAACEIRENLLKTLTGKSDREASHYRFAVLKDLGLCEFIKGNYDRAKKRLDSGVSELNLPNDDMMLTNQELAPVGLLRVATDSMKKFELTQAATSLRRSREIAERNLKKIMKYLHQQMSQQQGGGNVPPLQNLIDEIPGWGKTGQILPTLMPQAPILKQELPFVEQIDNAIEALDKQLAGFMPSQKTIRKTLDTSKGSKGGTLMYIRGLPTEASAPAERLMAAQELAEGVAKAFKEEGAAAEKPLTLLKRTKQGPGCKDDKGMTKTCAALAKVADLKSNSFGETRVLIVKANKPQPLELCSTNANVGILLAGQDGVSVSVGGASSELQAGVPLVVDFCQAVELSASKQLAVLFAQAWHPEFAAVERTTELRARAKTFSLSEDEVKEATKIVNDNAKKNWDKSAKQWRTESPFHESVKTALSGEVEEKKKKAEAEAEAKRKEEEAGDEERKKNIEELERKREQRRKEQEAAEEKRKARQKQLEQERANRDPWLNDPAVVEATKNIEELKEARRDANAKLEFDLSTSLTAEISAAERNLKKVTKKARKAFKKGGGQAGTKAAEEKKGDDAPSGDKTADIKKKLEDVKKQKKEASEKENFNEAKRLKGVQKDLEEQLKKLEL